MSLIDRVKNILKEAPERTPDKPSGLDFEGQSKKFVKNEKNKKKIMRKLEPKGSKQGELNLGNTKTTNTPLSTKRTLKGRPLGSKTKSKGETYKQLTTGSELKRQRKDIKKQFKTQQPISDLKKAKKYAKGEYPRIGGGGLKPDIKKPVKGTTPVKTNVSKVNVDKIFSGVGNVKTGGKVPDKNISPKSKGSTPVKTNISKVNVNKIFDKPKNPVTKTIGVKQSDVSKKAKEFTAKVNKANVKVQKNFVGRKANRVKGATLGKKTGSLRKGNLSFPGDRSGAYQATKSDIETRKGFKGKPGGLKADEKNPFVKTDVRKARATKLGGNIYDQPKFDQKKFEKGLQQTKKSKTFKTLPDPFKGSNTKTGSAIKDFKFQPRDISTSQAEKKASKSFAQFNKDLKKAGANIDIEKKVNNPSYRIGSRTSSSGGGGRPPRKINKKYKQGNLFDPPSGGSSSGGGGKPPRTPKGGPLVPPNDGVDPEVVKGKFYEKGKGGKDGFSNKQFKKLRKDRKKQFKQFMKQIKKSKVKGSGAYSSGATVASRYKRRYGKGFLKTITRAAAKHPKTAAIALGLGVLGAGYGRHQYRKRFDKNYAGYQKRGFNAYDNSTYAGSVVKKSEKSGNKYEPIKYTFGKKNKDNNDVPYRVKNPKSQKFISDKLKSGDYKLKIMSKNK